MASAVEGPRALQRIVFCYCQKAGSSRSMRHFIETKHLFEYARQHPQVTVEARVVPFTHPHIIAQYKNGVEHQVGCKVKDVDKIWEVADYLWQRTGRNMGNIRMWNRTKSKTRSLQGRWVPGMWTSEERGQSEEAVEQLFRESR
ncbi:MAG: hypothetical protein MHM6MM_004938 [Cercozoa sp. M6MM]